MTKDSKTILITGATSGFGQACAHMFVQNRWRVVISGRRQERLQEFCRQYPGADIHPMVMDVRKQKQVKECIKNLPHDFADVDVLVNNAGLALGLEPAHKADMNDWETMVDTNIKGLLYITRELLPKMVNRNKGHIINMGSVAGTYPYPGGNVYGASKAFVKQFSRNLLCDLLETKIKVTNIEPGLAQSEFSLVRFKGDQQESDKVYQGTSPITPQDIAEIIFWLANSPAHLNINTVEVMPVCQSCGPFAIYRE